MNKHTFKIEMQLPSLNNYINACRRNAHAGGAFKRESDSICAAYIRKARIPKIKNPVKIHFEWHERTIKRDLDNVAGYGHKTILDALVICGVLKDDSPKYVTGFTDRFVKDGKSGVIVTIEEVGNDDRGKS